MKSLKDVAKLSSISGAQLVLLELSETDQILALQDEAVVESGDTGMFFPDPEDSIRQWLSGKGIVVGVTVSGCLIAYTAVSLAAGFLQGGLSFPCMETSVVSREYRGYGLQTVMMNCVMALLDERTGRPVLSLCSPENGASLKSLMKCGFIIVRSVNAFAGLTRFLLIHDRGIRLHKKEVAAVSFREQSELTVLVSQGYAGKLCRKDSLDRICFHRVLTWKAESDILRALIYKENPFEY